MGGGQPLLGTDGSAPWALPALMLSWWVVSAPSFHRAPSHSSLRLCIRTHLTTSLQVSVPKHTFPHNNPSLAALLDPFLCSVQHILLYGRPMAREANLLACSHVILPLQFPSHQRPLYALPALGSLITLLLSTFTQKTLSASSAAWPPRDTWQWVKSGPRTCTAAAALTSSTPIASCVMSTTMEKAALSSAAPGMMLLVTSPVGSVERKSATRAGKASTALSVSIHLLVSLGAPCSSVS